MPNPTHVFVTVPEGREVPIPANEASAAGGTALRCKPGSVYVLPWSSYTRRRVTAGDFTLTNQGGTKVKDPSSAAASSAIKLDADGAVAKDQRSDAEIDAANARIAATTKFDTSDTKGKA